MVEFTMLFCCIIRCFTQQTSYIIWLMKRGHSMKTEPVILHSDINYCYAQIEEMLCPDLKQVAMAVGGYEELRHGIILAKNMLAKNYDIKTGDSLREALAKCPDLLIIPPHYDVYMYYTQEVKRIYRDYSDRVEEYGLDEAWIDISDSILLHGSPLTIANRIQQRVLNELGLTISIGISFNKVFAKFGSDMIKPSGLVEITHANFKELVWPQPIADLFYVGRRTATKLDALFGIKTIRDLALYDRHAIANSLGKMGEVIWWFANGEDASRVALSGVYETIKSVGNGITTPIDITSFEEAKLVYYVLCESVASRLREAGYKGRVISISLRSTALVSITRQRKITTPINLASEIMEIVLDLLKQHYSFAIPLRSIGISVSCLSTITTTVQTTLFGEYEQQEKLENLETTIDQIRTKYGFYKIKRCALKQNEQLTNFNPKKDHTIYPVGYF